MAWDCHWHFFQNSVTESQPKIFISIAVNVGYVKVRLRNRTQVRHNRLPMLMSQIIHVVMGKVILPLITVPTGIAVIGANVPKSNKEDLRAARLKRCVH